MPDPELALVPTEHEGHESAGEGVAVGSVRVEPVVSAGAPNSPPAGTAGGAAATASLATQPPLTPAEFEAIVGTIWADLDSDEFRIGDLLAVALGFIAGAALHEDTDPHDAARAAAVLRRMEQRALWGPEEKQQVDIVWAPI